MSITHIIIDLDGPLLDGKERHYYCYSTILQRFSFNPIAIDEYWELKRSRSSRMDLLNMSGAGQIYDDFLAAWLLAIESAVALALDKVQDGAISCLRRWQAQGIGLTLATMRNNKSALEEQLHATGLRPLLDTVLVCDHADGGVGKADVARSVLPDQVNLASVLWVGDTEADWEAARLLGCEVVLLANGLRSESYLRSLQGAVVAPSIASLNAPDELVGRFRVD